MTSKLMSMHHRLLILACSRSKRPGSHPLRAIDRYNGPSFRVLRKYLMQEPLLSKALDIYILSAEFGLISLTQEVPYYDRRMTVPRAQEISDWVKNEFKHIISSRNCDKLFINLGSDYMGALSGYEGLLAPSVEVTHAQGSLGRRLTHMRDWLYGTPPLTKQHPSGPIPVDEICIRTTYLRGLELKLTQAQVFNIARQALQQGHGQAESPCSWCVLVDGRPIAPKWLVSQLSGLPVSAFHTDEAKRVLQQLCIEVRRM